MNRFFAAIATIALTGSLAAANETPEPSGNQATSTTTTTTTTTTTRKPRLTIGGYGEVAMTRNFYSDSYLRYSDPASHKNESHGRFDLPHVVIFLGYDFGKGWSMGTEIEFEHGGTESAVEIEEEEAGEYESEVERGGEVALEQFWIQKTFMPQLSVRAGMMVVPVGQTNAHHLPTEFFGVYRPEGENTLMPCTWHEVGISLRGKAGAWSYEAMFLPGLDSDRFNSKGWIHDGAGSPYEFKIANRYAAAARLENRSVPGLTLALSGYTGQSFKNTLYPTGGDKNKGIKGTVTIGSFDFIYNARNIIARGHFDYGHLSDAKRITDYNMSMPKNSVSARQKIASSVISTGIEAGYNFFSLSPSLTSAGQRLYLFGRWDYYDSMYKMERDTPNDWCHRNRLAAGINWYPIRDIVVKGEYSIGLLDKRYNNEPAVSIGVAYSGWFNI